ncbi:MAG TPA: SRPBCC family protein [Gammaproteobacteria bacterium]|nr:SRPBCC family protein [Gammaproteobacteria bacterium]
MKWIIALLIFIIVLIVFGLLLPEKHRASKSARFNVSAEYLWEIITNFEAYPTWRSGVTRIERINDINGHPVWNEINSDNQGIPYETMEAVPLKRLVRRIADPALPFGGSWEFSLESTPEGTMLTITENGEVYNPVFRVISRFVFGHTKNMQAYLNDLQTRIDQQHKTSGQLSPPR